MSSQSHEPGPSHRRSIRLKNFDYTRAGAYFVTMVAVERAHVFGEIMDGTMQLNSFGEIARREWFATARLRPYVSLHENEFVVMPNHVHGIVWINKDSIDSVGAGDFSVGAERRSAPTMVSNANPPADKPRVAPRSLGAIVRAYKSAVTYAVNLARATRGAPVWQRNYHEHIIRDDVDLTRIRAYIVNNPAQWSDDSLR